MLLIDFFENIGSIVNLIPFLHKSTFADSLNFCRLTSIRKNYLRININSYSPVYAKMKLKSILISNFKCEHRS